MGGTSDVFEKHSFLCARVCERGRLLGFVVFPGPYANFIVALLYTGRAF